MFLEEDNVAVRGAGARHFLRQDADVAQQDLDRGRDGHELLVRLGHPDWITGPIVGTVRFHRLIGNDINTRLLIQA